MDARRRSSSLFRKPQDQDHHQQRWTQPTGVGGSPRRVISIPVQFVQSEATQQQAAVSALKIQKAVRGFLVRKSLKRIVAVKREVDEIERTIAEKEEVIRKDGKERLRVNETLMALLLKLDSVRGIGFGVRECRKGVIRKAIALQERVDHIASAEEEEDYKIEEEEENHQVACDLLLQQNVVDSDEQMEDMTTAMVVVADGDADDEKEKEKEKEVAQVDMQNNAMDAQAAMPTIITEVAQDDEPKTIHCMTECAAAAAEEPMKPLADDAGNLEEEEEKAAEEEEWEDVMKVDVEQDEEDDDEEQRRRRRGSRDLLEKMVEDNERLMGMVTELSQRNELQTKLLSSLTQRVEQLEKAFLSDMLARKKKKTGKKQ